METIKIEIGDLIIENSSCCYVYKIDLEKENKISRIHVLTPQCEEDYGDYDNWFDIRYLQKRIMDNRIKIYKVKK